MFRDLLKVTAHGIDSAETRTLDPTPSWASVRTLAVRGRIPPEGARGSCGPRPPRARLLSMVARARRSAARSRGGRAARGAGGAARRAGGAHAEPRETGAVGVDFLGPPVRMWCAHPGAPLPGSCGGGGGGRPRSCAA